MCQFPELETGHGMGTFYIIYSYGAGWEFKDMFSILLSLNITGNLFLENKVII